MPWAAGRDGPERVNSGIVREFCAGERETRQVYGEDRIVLASMEYLDGILDGTSRVFSSSGTLLQEVNYLAGEMHGPYRTWWDNGQPKEEGLHAGGKRVRMYRWYREDGTLLQEHDYG